MTRRSVSPQERAALIDAIRSDLGARQEIREWLEEAAALTWEAEKILP